MKIAALAIVGSLISASAYAQSASMFEPIPDTPPAYLFAPAPLAGTMLKPFVMRSHPAEVPPEPGSGPVVVAQTLPNKPATAQETVATSNAVAPQAEEQPPAPAASPEPPPAPAPKTGTVTVIVENVQSASGTVNVAVCDKSLSRDGCPYTHEIPAAPGFVETEFDDIPPGNYAVVGYHDVNGNNEFDKLFGMPREPYALSSKAGGMLVPTFADAALPISAGRNSVIIRLRRLGG
jgi:uncharacterized protein (DUF2141 family)